jgi:hypothetical protein
MKIPLTIKCDYLPTWGAYEGIRELLQNGQDAQTEFSAPLVVKHRPESNMLVIENEGAILPHEALLLGHTSKQDRPDLIGKFGEGLKLGILALVRAGHPVKIRSGGEVWLPSIQRSETFNADVLVFDITKGLKPRNRVAIEVGNIDAETWDQMKDCFLFLGTLGDDEVVRSISGGLLIGPRFEGKVYVKGIFVANDPRYSFGYDLVDADLDRDRKMVNKYDLQYRTSLIWREALGRRPDLVGSFGKLLEREAADVEGVDSWAAIYLPEEVKKTIADEFIKRHGDTALPVATLGESQDVEHLGKKGIVVPKSLRAVLEQNLGTADANKAKLKDEVLTLHGWHDLSNDEKANVERAIFLVNGVTTVSINDIDVATFRDPKLHGMFNTATGRILLAKSTLADRDFTLLVLVHEVAHQSGGDGNKDHIDRMQGLWSGIVARLSDRPAGN